MKSELPPEIVEAYRAVAELECQYVENGKRWQRVWDRFMALCVKHGLSSLEVERELNRPTEGLN
jgi:hypothetical protein